MFKSVLFYTDILKLLKRFYQNVLELEITDSTDQQFTVNIGPSQLIFVQSDRPATYKFAINIPGNQFTIMKYWIEDRIPLIREGGVNTFYSESFDADSMFFEDPAGNVIKLIGRRKRDLFGDLTSEAFLNVSEVSIITPFIPEVGDQLQDFGIPLHYGFEVNPESVNYLGKGDTYIALEPPLKRIIFSNQKETQTNPLTINLDNGGHIKLDEAGKITLTRTAEKEDK